MYKTEFFWSANFKYKWRDMYVGIPSKTLTLQLKEHCVLEYVLNMCMFFVYCIYLCVYAGCIHACVCCVCLYVLSLCAVHGFYVVYVCVCAHCICLCVLYAVHVSVYYVSFVYLCSLSLCVTMCDSEYLLISILFTFSFMCVYVCMCMSVFVYHWNYMNVAWLVKTSKTLVIHKRSPCSRTHIFEKLISQAA